MAMGFLISPKIFLFRERKYDYVIYIYKYVIPPSVSALHTWRITHRKHKPARITSLPIESIDNGPGHLLVAALKTTAEGSRDEIHGK